MTESQPASTPSQGCTRLLVVLVCVTVWSIFLGVVCHSGAVFLAAYLTGVATTLACAFIFGADLPDDQVEAVRGE